MLWALEGKENPPNHVYPETGSQKIRTISESKTSNSFVVNPMLPNSFANSSTFRTMHRWVCIRNHPVWNSPIYPCDHWYTRLKHWFVLIIVSVLRLLFRTGGALRSPRRYQETWQREQDHTTKILPLLYMLKYTLCISIKMFRAYRSNIPKTSSHVTLSRARMVHICVVYPTKISPLIHLTEIDLNFEGRKSPQHFHNIPEMGTLPFV